MNERLNFTNSRKQSLVGVLELPDRPDSHFPVVIFAHGMGSSKESKKALELARRLKLYGIAVFRFDFTGCGESDGRFSDTLVSRLADDLKAAYNKVYSHERVDINRIGIVGSSLGGMVSILAVYQGLNPKTMVLISPATDFKENHSKPRVEDCISNEFYLDTWKRDFYEMAGFIKVPVLVVHGDVDDVCFLSGSRKLAEKLGPESMLEVIKGEGHYYKRPEGFDRMMDLTVGWLRRHL